MTDASVHILELWEPRLRELSDRQLIMNNEFGLTLKYLENKFFPKVQPNEALIEDVPWSSNYLALSPDAILDAIPDSSSGSASTPNPALSPSTPSSQKCYITALSPELILLLLRFMDLTTATCLGLTCHTFFNITEHLYPFSVPLHMRTKGPSSTRRCLGHLLTDWMAPKYSFDHSWGVFLLAKEWKGRRGKREVEEKWREKEGWNRIALVRDKIGAVVAYESQTRGF